MDLNDLYQRHQISLHLAENASSAPARAAHGELAAAYAARIADARRPRLELVA